MKIFQFRLIEHQLSIDRERHRVLNTKAHIFDQSREIFDWSKQLKILKPWNLIILCRKTTWKDVFKTQCIWTWSRKVLKTWCLLNANIKTNQEVKNKDFKHLNTFFFKFQPKTKICICTSVYMQLKMARLVDKQSYV